MKKWKNGSGIKNWSRQVLLKSSSWTWTEKWNWFGRQFHYLTIQKCLYLYRKYEECIVDLKKALEKGASDRTQHKLCDKMAGCYVILKKHDLVRMRILVFHVNSSGVWRNFSWVHWQGRKKHVYLKLFLPLLAIIAKIASRWGNELCCIKHCWGVSEQSSIVNGVRVDDWTVEEAIIANNEHRKIKYKQVIFSTGML